jgi:hypothetical protein
MRFFFFWFVMYHSHVGDCLLVGTIQLGPLDIWTRADCRALLEKQVV